MYLDLNNFDQRKKKKKKLRKKKKTKNITPRVAIVLLKILEVIKKYMLIFLTNSIIVVYDSIMKLKN